MKTKQGIINADGSRNWQANILLDNVKRLEEENKELKQQIESQKGLITVGGKQQYEYLQKIDELEQENAELKAENDRLKEEIKEVKKYQYEQEFLEKEIEEQREKNKRLTCKILEVKALNETLNVQCTSQDCTQLRKLHQTLQEIKAIAETELSYDMVGNEHRHYRNYDIIRHLITKAEEEWMILKIK